MKDFACVKTFTNRFEADLAKTFLDINEIQCYVTSDDAGGVHTGLTYVSGVKLMVRKNDLDVAVKLLETDFANETESENPTE